MDFNNILKKRKESETYRYFEYGEDYYKSRNTEIFKREKKVYSQKYGVVSNPFMANHTLGIGHLQPIVDQKVNYLLGNGIKFGDKQDLDIYFEDGFYETIIDLATTASVKAEAWLYMYKDNGKTKFTEVKPEQLAPVYDEKGILQYMIRAYDDVMLVYSKDGVEKFAIEKNEYKKQGEYGHYSTNSKYQGEVVEKEEKSFGFVPFIPLYNNRNKISDLFPIKPAIDVRDIVNSDFANNIDDMQDAFYTLKGYSGNAEDLIDFMRELKASKAIPIAENGDVGVHQLQVPVEARKEFLDRIDKDIYKTAMAVDFETMLKGDSTNVGIMAAMTNLDLKADKFETEIRRFLKKLISAINLVDNKTFSYDATFERSMIMNKEAYVEKLVLVADRISRETFLKLLPYDINVEEELQKMDDNRAINPISVGESDDTENE